MDREHPIPQEVSTYEFRLVGDMTIKQFMQVAVGALISLVIYSSGLAPYVKWPLIIISFLSGIALAFFPIEDRPLALWISLFLKAIYSPTVYVWDKNARRSQIFQPESDEVSQASIAVAQSTTPALQAVVSAQPLPTTEDENKFEKTEAEFLNKVDLQFSGQIPPVPAVQPSNQPQNTVQLKQTIQPGESKLIIPQSNTVKVEQQQKQVQPDIPPENQSQTQTGNYVAPSLAQKPGDAKLATFSQEASPPTPPTRPNVIIGQVLDPTGKIIDGAILDIKDSDGRPVRALRSNRLGHFMIVTPLANGKYQITTEKEGFTFDAVSFEAKDEIIPPIAIWAKS